MKTTRRGFLGLLTAGAAVGAAAKAVTAAPAPAPAPQPKLKTSEAFAAGTPIPYKSPYGDVVNLGRLNPNEAWMLPDLETTLRQARERQRQELLELCLRYPRRTFRKPIT